MAEEAMQSAAGAAAAAARSAIDVCLSGGAFGGFTFSLKIDNPWLAAGIAIGTFYIANKALTERAIRNALQQQTSSTANVDPEVTSISTGSILVQLQCYTEESFLRFTDDIDSKKAKYQLEEELATVGFREEIRLTVENKEELEVFRQKLFPVSVSPQEDKVNLSSDLMPRRQVPSSPLPKERKVDRQQSDDSHPQEEEEMKFYTVEVNHSMWEVPERYDSIQSLGYDTHGQLCAATDKQSQESVVIKKLARPFDSLISCVNTFREICLLKHIKHDTIIHFHDLFTPQKTLREFSSVYLVYKSQTPPSASLDKILSTQITEDHLKYLAYELFRALMYLHSMELVLLDLAPRHIFVNESVELQIQNLASARKVHLYGPSDKMSGYVGTRWYRAPEMILNVEGLNGKVDVWSVGCILYELATGKVLFPGKDHLDQLTKIFDVLGTPEKALIEKCSISVQKYLTGLPLKEKRDLSEYLQPSNASAGFVAFLERILLMDPSERISAAEALRDPFLEEYHDPDDEPLAEPFDDSFEQWKDLGKDKWKEKIFEEICNFVA